MSLRSVRADKANAMFVPSFFERDERFLGIAQVASLFADCVDWPSVEAIDATLSARAGIRFTEAKRRPRRERGPVDLDDLYDAHIARGAVPTRARNWHDFVNALVWAAFPRSKAALHARQHRAVQAWARSEATLIGPHRVVHLPGARTRELDALAILDEGGVLVTAEGQQLFGHALYEGLILGVRSMIARAVSLTGSADVDAQFAERLAGDITPEAFSRLPL